MPVSSARSKRRRIASGGTPGRGMGIKDGLYHCDYCHKDLSSTLRIKCDVCSDFDLCLECFSVGVEIASHKNTHAYRVLDNMSFPIYTLDWGADEEMLLLEAVELYGIGSWARTAEHVGRTELECRQHYYAVYIETDTFPEPKPSANLGQFDIQKLIESHRASHYRLGGGDVVTPFSESLLDASTADVTTTADEEEEGMNDGDEKTGPTAVKPEAEAGANGLAPKGEEEKPSIASKGAVGGAAPAAAAATVGVPASASPRTCGGLSPHLANGEEQQRPESAAPNTAGPPGTAQKSVTPSVVALSEAQQTGYHAKREEFDPEYDNEAEHIVADLEFTPTDTPEEEARKLHLIDIYNKRLDSRANHKKYALTRGLINVKKAQALDRRRTAVERELVSKVRVVARYLPQPTFDSLADDVVAEQRLRARIRELQQYRSLGLRTFVEVDAYEAAYGTGKKEAVAVIQPGKSRLDRIHMDDASFELELAMLNQLHAADALHRHHMAMTEGRGNEALQGWRVRRGALLDIATLPDSEPLSHQERILCSTERYLPAQFMAIKGEALRVQDDEEGVAAHLQQPPFRIDPDRSLRLHEYFKTAHGTAKK